MRPEAQRWVFTGASRVASQISTSTGRPRKAVAVKKVAAKKVAAKKVAVKKVVAKKAPAKKAPARKTAR